MFVTNVSHTNYGMTIYNSLPLITEEHVTFPLLIPQPLISEEHVTFPLLLPHLALIMKGTILPFYGPKFGPLFLVFIYSLVKTR